MHNITYIIYTAPIFVLVVVVVRDRKNRSQLYRLFRACLRLRRLAHADDDALFIVRTDRSECVYSVQLQLCILLPMRPRALGVHFTSSYTKVAVAFCRARARSTAADI